MKIASLSLVTAGKSLFSTNKLCSFFAIASVMILSGCATHPIPVNYAPSSVKSATGALSVADFTYTAKSKEGDKPLPPNKIRNTALGDIRIDRDVHKFVRDAVFAELRFVGIKTNDPAKSLTGEVQEFLIDDLGYSVDWTLRIKYTLIDTATKSVLFEDTQKTQRHTAKFANAFGALNEIIKVNVEQLLDDEKFMKAIN